ncbi:MAG TPA: hypothetical protein VG276_27960 [Actinomycetes bacterium]|jgi:hypothetical protein|nr:hypothetical protein [Actinomycetes bacterium]
MPRYEVLKDYRSGGHGPWEKGSKIELDADDAEWVNRDSSDTLKQIPGLGEEAKTGTQPAGEETAGERSAGSQGAMTTADHPGITRPSSSSRSSNRRRG